MSEPWYSVKCLFYHPGRNKPGEDYLYEERITLWRAPSFEEAHRLAESEALEYAASGDVVFVSSTDSFHLFGSEVAEGAEIYSTMRGSNMEPPVYKKTFCITDRDRSRPLGTIDHVPNQSTDPAA